MLKQKSLSYSGWLSFKKVVYSSSEENETVATLSEHLRTPFYHLTTPNNVGHIAAEVWWTGESDADTFVDVDSDDEDKLEDKSSCIEYCYIVGEMFGLDSFFFHK